MSVIAHLEPKALWKHFDEICKIPHGSGNEKALGDYVLDWAKQKGIRSVRDEVGNVILYKEAAAGCEKSPTVVMQGHLDMVNEKHSTSAHDFTKDPIKLILDGDWLKADGTTLGADNGVGVAAALSILEEKELVHGPLEVLLTIDEERGLNGARSITSDLLQGRLLLNLDSEELGVFSIGCAGGADTHLTLPLRRIEAKGEKVLYLHLSGLRGGHSGIDIHEGRGNALKILNRLLWQLSQEIKVELVSLNGGDKHNAIPREAFAEIVLRKKDVPTAREWLGKAMEEIRQEFKPVEGAIELALEELKGKLPKVLDKESKEKLLGLIFSLPHGPLAMSRSMKGLVETSNNLAAIKMSTNKAILLLSSRSSNGAALRATRNKLAAIAAMAGAKTEQPEGYPGWMPNVDSPLLKIASDTFKAVTGKKAQAMAIHAGLECGIIGEKFPGMDMISFGPDLKHPHSPEEMVNVKSVVKFYDHLRLMIETLAKS